MKSSKEFKAKLHDEEFAKLFATVKSPEEVVKIAHEQGYDISIEEVENYELSDDMLENIAGGKMSQKIVIYGDNGAPITIDKIVQKMDGTKE